MPSNGNCGGGLRAIVFTGWLVAGATAARAAPALELQPDAATTGVNGFFTLAALYDPDGSGPAETVNVSSQALFVIADTAVSSMTRSVVTREAVFRGKAPGATPVTASFAGLSATATIEVSGTVASRSFVTPDGRTRSYRFYVPGGLTGPSPLLIALHGGGGQGLDLEILSNMDVVAADRGFVVVYPDAIQDPDGGHWNDGRALAGYEAQLNNVDDVSFLASLIDRVAAETPVNRRRVYVSGFSNGSLMAKRMACERSDLVAAVGTGGSTLPNNVLGNCIFTHPMPLFHFHGTDDRHAPWTGGDLAGGSTLSVPELIDLWTSKNGCAGAASIEDLPDARNDGTRIRRDAFPCPANGAVELYTVEGAGHTWPGGFQYLPEENPTPNLAIGKTNRDLWISPLMWDFLSRFALPESGAEVGPAPRGYPNPWRSTDGAAGIALDRLPPGARARIYAMTGEPVREIRAPETGAVLWDLRDDRGEPVESGVYLVHVPGNGHRLKVVVQR